MRRILLAIIIFISIPCAVKAQNGTVSVSEPWPYEGYKAAFEHLRDNVERSAGREFSIECPVTATTVVVGKSATQCVVLNKAGNRVGVVTIWLDSLPTEQKNAIVKGCPEVYEQDDCYFKFHGVMTERRWLGGTSYDYMANLAVKVVPPADIKQAMDKVIDYALRARGERH